MKENDNNLNWFDGISKLAFFFWSVCCCLLRNVCRFPCHPFCQGGDRIKSTQSMDWNRELSSRLFPGNLMNVTCLLSLTPKSSHIKWLGDCENTSLLYTSFMHLVLSLIWSLIIMLSFIYLLNVKYFSHTKYMFINIHHLLSILVK